MFCSILIPMQALSPETRMIFEVIHGTHEVRAHTILRHAKPVSGAKSVGFIESTKYLSSKLKRCCTDAVVAYGIVCKGRETTWYLGIIEGLSWHMK